MNIAVVIMAVIMGVVAIVRVRVGDSVGMSVSVIMETVVMAMVVFVVMLMNDNIVIWVTIIRHEGTTIIITGKLNLIDIDFVDRSNKALTIRLKNSLSLADCSSGKLSWDIRVNINVTSNVIERIAMST